VLFVLKADIQPVHHRHRL